MNKIISLEEFWNSNYPDGFYAVWKVGKIFDEDKFLFGFSGDVVEYNQHEGFKNGPEWFENAEEKDVNIILLAEIPSVEQLHTGEF